MKPILSEVSGLLLLNKAPHISSNHALQQVKRLFQAKKAGHTGTLDPLATGLLPICFGEATKFSQYLLNANKTYLATLQFGEATTTGDREGAVIARSCTAFQAEELLAASQKLLGWIEQIPPMFSAIKHKGLPLYQYALKGIPVPREKRKVYIQTIELIQFSFPEVVLKITCSKGTYIRTLAEDLAQSLGSVAHLSALSRIQSDQFTLEKAYSFSQLEKLSATERAHLLFPVDYLVKHLDSVVLNLEDETKIKTGRPVQFYANYAKMTPLSLYTTDDRFVGLGVYVPDLQVIRALRLLRTNKDT
ncbi:MAG: tRNA pseudouridine(55) synthase TruB [Neisseriaceae bacterium]